MYCLVFLISPLFIYNESSQDLWQHEHIFLSYGKCAVTLRLPLYLLTVVKEREDRVAYNCVSYA